MSFLTAEWRKLILVNYTVAPRVLLPYVPLGTELDLYDGKCYISLVGFLFKNTKLLGIPVPYHRNFEEVNLRFYVKYKDHDQWKRGVVFIKEIVPKPALTFIANTLYKEHYQTLPMHHYCDDHHLEYQWKASEKQQHIKVHYESTLLPILPNTISEFITEHYFGYAKHELNTYEYEVTHPRWEQYEITDFDINVDFLLNYGSSFRHLNTQNPESIILAEGSKITVEHKNKIY